MKQTSDGAVLEIDDDLIETPAPPPEPAPPDESESGRAARRPARRWVRQVAAKPWTLRVAAVVVVALLVGASVVAVVLGRRLADRDAVDDAARQAAVTAQSYAVLLTSIDSHHIDQNFAQVLDGATGAFKDMYAQSSDQLKSLLTQDQAVSQGKVLDCSVMSASRDQVQVMLFVDQTVTNSLSPAPRVDRSRIVMTMDRVGGRWVASKVDVV